MLLAAVSLMVTMVMMTNDPACEHVSGLTGASEGRSRLTVGQHLIDCFVRSPAEPGKTVFVFVFVSCLIGFITVFLIQAQSSVPDFFWCRIFIFVGFNQSQTTNLVLSMLILFAAPLYQPLKKKSFFFHFQDDQIDHDPAIFIDPASMISIVNYPTRQSLLLVIGSLH